MIITLIVMTVLMFAVVSTLKIVVQARERQTATALATQALEKMRALPSTTVTQPEPLVLPTAAFTTGSAGAYKFAPPAGLLSGVTNESLVVNKPASTQPSWLGSGQGGDVVVGTQTYTVSTYVTRPTGSTTTEEYSLTAIVSWTSSAFPSGRMVAQRSAIFTGGECLSSGTSPYAAPCQGFFTAQAGVKSGGLSVTEPLAFDPAAPIVVPPPEPPVVLDLVFSGLSTSTLLEQTASGSALAVGGGANRLGASPASSGGVSIAALVDSDPSSSASSLLTGLPRPSHSSGSLSYTTAALGSLEVDYFGGSSRSAAGIAAESSLCRGLNDAAIATGPAGALRPCSSGDFQQSGTSVLTFNPAVAPDDVEIAQFSAQADRDRAVSAVIAAANPGVACSSGGSPSCSHAAAQRSFGTVKMGHGAVDPLAGSVYDPTVGLWSVTDFSETAKAEEGVGAGAPAFARSGQLKVWTEVSPLVFGYVTLDLSAPLAGAVTYDIPATTLMHGATSVTYQGAVTVQPWTTSESGPATCIDDTCVSNSSADGSVSSVMTVTVTDGTGFTRFTVSSDLGGLLARASYKAVAP